MIFQFGAAIGGIILAAIIIAAIGIKWGEDGPASVRPSGIFLGVLILIAGVVGCGSLVQINPSEIGIIVELGRVTDRTLPEGVHALKPFVQHAEVMDLQVHKLEAPAEAASRDLQDVQTTVAVNYRLDARQAARVYQDLRRDYVIRILEPNIQEAVKAVTALYNADQLITERSAVKHAIEIALSERVASRGIIIEALSLTSFNFSEVFNAAIEAKVEAAQRALQAENQLRQIEVEARQVATRAEGEKNATIQKAEGDRQAVVARAQGEAESIRLRAEAQAKANLLVAQSVTDLLIRWQVASTLAPDIHTVVIPAGSDFIFGPEILGR